jgi:hypothetical protein
VSRGPKANAARHPVAALGSAAGRADAAVESAEQALAAELAAPGQASTGRKARVASAEGVLAKAKGKAAEAHKRRASRNRGSKRSPAEQGAVKRDEGHGAPDTGTAAANHRTVMAKLGA